MNCQENDTAETEALPVVEVDGLRNVADGAEVGPVRSNRRRHSTIIVAVGVVLALVAVYAGGAAYTARLLEAAKASYAGEQSAYNEKTSEARNLARAAKGGVLDPRTIETLNAAAARRVPAPGQTRPWALWEEVPVLHDYGRARAALDNDSKAINRAIAEVSASRSAKRVKDAKDALSNADGSAKKLLADSNGKVADNGTRDALSAAIDGADNTLKTPATGLKPGLAEAYTAALKPLAGASRQVEDSIKAKSDADTKAAADAAAAQSRAAAQPRQSYAQTPAYGNYGGGSRSYASGGSGGYRQTAAPRQQARAQSQAQTQTQTQANNGGGQGGGFDWNAWVAEQNKHAIQLSPADRCKVFGDCSGLQ